jgi:hypothetical protein
MSLGIGPHDTDCQCARCSSRRQTFAPKCPRCGVSLLSYRPVSEFDDAHHLSRDGERPMIRCAELKGDHNVQK